MEVLSWILWVGGLWWGLSWAYGVRYYVRTGREVSQLTVNQTMLIVASVVAVPLLDFSPFHLLWLLPLAFIVGRLSLVFPFSLVSLFGRPFGHICCLGLNHAEVARNTQRVEQRVERFRELVRSGMSPEQAEEQLNHEET